MKGIGWREAPVCPVKENLENVERLPHFCCQLKVKRAEDKALSSTIRIRSRKATLHQYPLSAECKSRFLSINGQVWKLRE